MFTMTIAIALLPAASGRGEPATLPIERVTVYEDRALVRRAGDVRLEKGVQTIRIGDLPPDLEASSLRAGLQDPARGRVISIWSDKEVRKEIQDERLRELEAQADEVRRRIAEIDDALARARIRERLLAAYDGLGKRGIEERSAGSWSPGAKAPGEDAGTWRRAAAWLLREKRAVLARRRELEARKRPEEERLADRERAIAQVRKPEERSTRTAEIAIDAPRAGEARIWLSYLMRGAAWRPRYDARLDPASRKLQFTYFGAIRQNTGEDWRGVALVLSTARPSVGARRPELSPLRLSLREAPQEGKAIAARRVEVPDLEVNQTGVSPVLAPRARAPEPAPLARAREAGVAVAFQIRGRADIPADGRPHKVPITSFAQDVETSFETVPKRARFVYLKGRARNATGFPMLAGRVDVFRASGFIGTSHVEFTAPDAAFDLSFGIEESLKVRRDERERTSRRAGSRVRIGRAYEIEVANFAGVERTVAVLENIPVSDVEEVDVELDPSTTKPAEVNEEDGILTWRLRIPPQEARSVRLAYEVTLPKGIDLGAGE